MNRHQKNTYKEGNKMKKSKVTIALVLAGLMLLGTAGMAFASEDKNPEALVGQEVAVEAAEGDEVPEGEEIVQGFFDGYKDYRCAAPEYLNVRTNKSTVNTSNIVGHILANVYISARSTNDGWAEVNFCGKTCYVSMDYLVSK